MVLPTFVRPVLSGVTLFLSIVAFALGICCLLAGTNPNTLPNMEIFTLNTSRIGAHIQQGMGLPPPNPDFNFSSILPRDLTNSLDKAKDSLTKQGSNIIGDATQAVKDPKKALENLKANITSTVADGKKSLDAAANKIKDNAKNATSSIVSTFINETISTLDIHDFYTAHLITSYCEGTYKDGKKQVTYCSNGKGKNSTSNSTKKEHDGPFAFIDDLHLPDPIEVAMMAIGVLSKIIAGVYIIALVFLAIAAVTTGYSLVTGFKPWSGGSKCRKASVLLTILAFLFLLLGSILAQKLSEKVIKTFTGQHLGLEAQMGKNFLNMSYAALGFTGAAIVAAVAEFWVAKLMDGGKGFGKKMVTRLWYRQKARKEKEQYGDVDEYEAGTSQRY